MRRGEREITIKREANGVNICVECISVVVKVTKSKQTVNKILQVHSINSRIEYISSLVKVTLFVAHHRHSDLTQTGFVRDQGKNCDSIKI